MFEFYFAYKNYLNHEYYGNLESCEQLINRYKLHECHRQNTQVITKNISEDIKQSNIKIQKGYYVVSFNNSEVSLVSQIKDFYLCIDDIGYDICFDTDNSMPHNSDINIMPYKDWRAAVDKSMPPNSDVNIIVKTEGDIKKIAKCVQLQKAHIPKNIIVEKIESQAQFIKQPKIMDVLALNKEFIFVKGTFNFSLVDDESGYEYPFFGMFLQNADTFLIEEFHELLQVLLIDEEYYFVTYWEKAESGRRGLIIYKLEKEALVKVFADGTGST